MKSTILVLSFLFFLSLFCAHNHITSRFPILLPVRSSGQAITHSNTNICISLRSILTLLIDCSPITYAWHGGVMAFQDPDMNKLIVTKKQYEENGTAFCLEKFDSWCACAWLTWRISISTAPKLWMSVWLILCVWLCGMMEECVECMGP